MTRKQDKIDAIRGDELVLAMIADYKKQVDFENCTWLSDATKERIIRIERGLVRHIDTLLNPKPKRTPPPAPPATVTGITKGAKLKGRG